MDNADIRRIALEICNSPLRPEQRRPVYEHMYKAFSEAYPTLFGMSCDGKMDLAKLDFMLKMWSNVKSNTMNQHDASVNVGQALFETYVKPKINE